MRRGRPAVRIEALAEPSVVACGNSGAHIFRRDIRDLGQAGRRVGQVAQPVNFIGAPQRRQNEELPPFRMLAGIDQRATRGHIHSDELHMRPARRTECQGQDRYGEEYAAY